MTTLSTEEQFIHQPALGSDCICPKCFTQHVVSPIGEQRPSKTVVYERGFADGTILFSKEGTYFRLSPDDIAMIRSLADHDAKARGTYHPPDETSEAPAGITIPERGAAAGATATTVPAQKTEGSLRSPQGEGPIGEYERAGSEGPKGSASESPAQLADEACPTCHGCGVVGTPGGPCPMCKLWSIGRQIANLRATDTDAEFLREIDESHRTVQCTCTYDIDREGNRIGDIDDECPLHGAAAKPATREIRLRLTADMRPFQELLLRAKGCLDAAADIKAQRDQLAEHLAYAIANIQGIADGSDAPSMVIREQGRQLLQAIAAAETTAWASGGYERTALVSPKETEPPADCGTIRKERATEEPDDGRQDRFDLAQKPAEY